MAESELAATARVYAHAGWSVFPLWWISGGRCACPRGAACTSPGKHPLTRQGVHEASAEPSTVAARWRRWPVANIGLPAGGNGLAILDVDPRHGGHESLSRLLGWLVARGRSLPATLTQVTGGGGLHLIYAAPAGGIKGGANVLGPSMGGIDTRGRGGYVVAAPSTHASGGVYRWVDFCAETAPWPADLERLMNPPRPEGGRATTPGVPGPASDPTAAFLSTSPGYAHTALRGELDRVRGAAEGTRNHTLNRAAFSLGQLVAAGLLDHDAVAEALVEAAADCGLSGREVVLTIRSGLRGGARAPREIGGAA